MNFTSPRTRHGIGGVGGALSTSQITKPVLSTHRLLLFITFNYRSLSPSLLLSLFLVICTYSIYSISKLQVSLSLISFFEELSRAEGLFDRILLYGYELLSFFPPQTLSIVFYERNTLGMMMMMMTKCLILRIKFYLS